MKAIKTQGNQSTTNIHWNPQSEWSDVQEERLQNHTSIMFFITICSCGAHSMWKIEFIDTQIPNDDDSTVEEAELKCPSCGGIYKTTITCNNYHGLQVRLLESWHEQCKIIGMEDENVSLKQQINELEQALDKEKARNYRMQKEMETYIRHRLGSEPTAPTIKLKVHEDPMYEEQLIQVQYRVNTLQLVNYPIEHVTRHINERLPQQISHELYKHLHDLKHLKPKNQPLIRSNKP